MVGLATLILIYAFGILPLVEAKKRAEEEIALKKRVLLKYEEYLSNRKTVEEELDRTLKQHEEVQKSCFPERPHNLEQPISKRL